MVFICYLHTNNESNMVNTRRKSKIEESRVLASQAQVEQVHYIRDIKKLNKKVVIKTKLVICMIFLTMI